MIVFLPVIILPLPSSLPNASLWYLSKGEGQEEEGAKLARTETSIS